MAANRRRCVPVLEQCEPRFLPGAIALHQLATAVSNEVRMAPVTPEIFASPQAGAFGLNMASTLIAAATKQPRPAWG